MKQEYGKLINGILRRAPNTVKWEDEEGNLHTVNNPDEDKLLELGYYPLTYIDPPTDAPDGKHYESGWEQIETEIIQTWNLVEDPVYPEPEPTMYDLTQAVERGLNS